MKPIIDKRVPCALRMLCPCLCGARPLVKNLGHMKRIEERIAKKVPQEVLAGGPEAVRESLRRHLVDLESRLVSHRGEYLLGTAAPAACDYALYAMLDRLIGDSGYSIGAVVPQVLQDAHCEALRQFYWRMKAACPVRFEDEQRVPRGESFLPPPGEQLSMRLPAGAAGAL
mmetsp:Transcript_33663/g.106404  ORF Transcript_33663/g.106404 Transcript_33663/m.106404 type:complete len:171 (+) Transcript_33663:97-609(+)